MTNGDPGIRRQPRKLAFLIFAILGLGYVVVNALSEIDDRRTLGRPIDAWEPWTWEATSLCAWLILAPLVFRFARSLRTLGGLGREAAVHAVLIVPFSLAHTGLAYAMRWLIYAAVGSQYRLGSSFSDVFVYELRKDAITYLGLVAAYLIADRLVQPKPAPASLSDERPLIEVRDGTRTAFLRPEEIEWIAAAGNYVEIYGQFGSRLLRRPLAQLEEELAGAGFVRVHRSRIVRRSAIAGIDVKQSGDFEATLRSGTVVSGSRRYRAALERPG